MEKVYFIEDIASYETRLSERQEADSIDIKNRKEVLYEYEEKSAAEIDALEEITYYLKLSYDSEKGWDNGDLFLFVVRFAKVSAYYAILAEEEVGKDDALYYHYRSIATWQELFKVLNNFSDTSDDLLTIFKWIKLAGDVPIQHATAHYALIKIRKRSKEKETDPEKIAFQGMLME